MSQFLYNSLCLCLSLCVCCHSGKYRRGSCSKRQSNSFPLISAKEMEGFDMEGSNPSSSSVCLCVSTTEPSGEQKTRWFIIFNEATSILGPCHKENVKKMEKEAKRRANLVKKITEMFISGRKVEEMGEFFSTPVTPVCETPNMAAIGCFWTALGSVVYFFGATRGSHKVKYWDLAEIQKGKEALSPGVVLAPTVVQRRGQKCLMLPIMNGSH